MYSEHVETLSISLPTFFVHFIDNYIAKDKSKSPSVVIQDALQLLFDREQQRVEGNVATLKFDREQQDRELEQAYRDAAQEFDTDWEITASDGLSHETW
jgi:Arc/MetJ-type ribon-helix-helix transcriptional regulator